MALGAAVAMLLAFAASAGAAQLAFVGNAESDSVSVVDTATNQVVGSPIPVGRQPASIAVTPDGRFAYVANSGTAQFGGQSVSVIDTAARQGVATVEVGEFPFGLAITPDGGQVFVTDRGSNEVSVIDTGTNQVVAEIEVGSEPTGVAITPDGAWAYVANFGDGTVERINTTTFAVVGEPIHVGEHPEGIEFTPDGKTAFVADQGNDAVSAIDTATRKVTPIPLPTGEQPRGIVVSPDGLKAFVVNLASDSVAVIDTQARKVTKEIPVASGPQEVAIAANGKTVYVTETGKPLERVPQVQTIDVETGAVVGSPIALPGEFPAGMALTPDQSPTAVFSPPSVTATVPATFSGAASTDPDGTIASWSWAFGDGATATGSTPTHTYALSGTYNAALSVVDNEGCSVAEVFTGRTALCSGNPLAKVVHPIEVKVPPTACSSRPFRITAISHNRKNGTARMRVKLPAPGSIFLFGKKVHAVTRNSVKTSSTMLTVHARVELNKRLKKTHRAQVKVRVTYTPSTSCGSTKTLHRSFALLRAPRKKHHGG